ncbi:hypothetical protein ACLKA7_015410 [Drosophila subpalustris]
MCCRHLVYSKVKVQMRRNKKLISIELFVKKSLSSLTHLGILVRSGTSEYALRQSLVFDQGVSAIPWKTTTESTAKKVKPKHTTKMPKSMKTKPRTVKNRIVKTKLRDIATKTNQDKKVKGLVGMESHPAYSAFLNTFKDLKNDRPAKNIRRSVTHMDVKLMDGTEGYSGSAPANCTVLFDNFNCHF